MGVFDSGPLPDDDTISVNIKIKVIQHPVAKFSSVNADCKDIQIPSLLGSGSRVMLLH